MQHARSASYFQVSAKASLFVCIISFMLIHQYDAQWNLPVLAWQLMGVFAGDGWTRVLSGFIILCWLYLWMPLIQGPVLNAKLITAFTVLYAITLFAGYQQIGTYSKLGHISERVLFYILPFLIFTISSILLFKKLVKSAY